MRTVIASASMQKVVLVHSSTFQAVFTACFLNTTNLGGDAADELLDIKLGWAALLAWSIGALETTSSLTESTALAQGGVLDIVEILGQGAAIL
jgi:hypothetical protein